MRISFDRPLYLLCALPLLVLTVLPFFLFRKKKHRPSGRAWTALGARVLAFLLLTLSLSGLFLRQNTQKNSVILLADLSDSMKQARATVETCVKYAETFASPDTEIGLVTFGYNSEYELPLSDRFHFSTFETAPNGTYTDIYSALIRAAALLPEQSNKRIILVTDGKENIGDVTAAANVLSSRNIRLDAIQVQTGATQKEIQLSDISVPDVIYDGENFNITVTVESNEECDAVLRLSQDGIVSHESEIRLSKGINRYVFRETAESAGISAYTAEIYASGDWVQGNNRIYTFIKVLGTPKILVIDGSGSEAHEFTQIVGSGVQCDVMPPPNAPDNIADLRKYECIVLMNTAKPDLPEGFDTLLETYVRKLGRGLLTTGGDNAYIMGGWKDSDLEKILPVEMTVKDEMHLADVGLLLLIDNSGSMSDGGGPQSLLELAKTGAIKAVDTVKSIDKVGVIAFSDNAVWISRLVSGAQKATVQNKIASLQIGGGTMLHSSLEEAYTALSTCGASVRSVVLLTDGDPADDQEILASGILQKMKKENITVNCIAVTGGGPASNILKAIAGTTGGNLTVVNREEDLPKIILSETVKATAGSYLKNETFFPTVRDYTSLLSGVDSLPALDGFVLTEAKGLAYVELNAAEEAPLLASWQYGLGKVVSYMSDVNGKWSSGFLASEGGQKLLRNMVSWVLPADTDTENGSVTVTRSGDKGIVTLKTAEGKDGVTSATVISPSGKETVVPLLPNDIGTYSGTFSLEEEGSYVTMVTQSDANGNVTLSKETAMAVTYSDEYNMFSENNGNVSVCCEATGGKGDWTDIRDIFAVRLRGADARTDLSTPLLIFALLLLMTDIAVRRLDIRLFAVLRQLREKKKAAAAAEAPGTSRPAEARPRTEKPADKPGKEITEEYRPEKPKKADKAGKEKKAPPKPEENAGTNIASLLKEIDNSKRRKM